MSKRINQDRSEGTDGDENEKFLADVRGVVWDTQKEGGTWDKFANEANLSPPTVARFASGTTKRPHANTLRAILFACGYRLAIVKEDRAVEGEFTLSPAQRRAQRKRLGL